MAREASGVNPEFVRLFHGRLWHVSRPRLEYAAAEEDLIGAAWCGESWPTSGRRAAERLEGVVPANGTLCQRCIAAITRYRLTVMGMARVRALSTEPLPDDVVDAEIVEDDEGCLHCDHMVHVGTCQARLEDDPLDEWCTCYVSED